MLNIKTLFNALKGASNIDRKFILSILLDVISNAQMYQIVKSLSWTQGLETLLNSSFAAEPIAVSLIFQHLSSDPIVLSQMNNMMSAEYLDEVIGAA